MKFLKICVIALSAATFASCSGKQDCKTSATDSTTTSATAVMPATGGTDATVNGGTPEGSTGESATGTAATGSGERESRATRQVTGRDHGMTRNDTLAESKAGEAKGAKKRAGNFTNGSPN